MQQERRLHAGSRPPRAKIFEMVYCFDTSGINKLYDDPYNDAIVAGILAPNTVWITAINIIEVCKTRDRDRLVSLMRLLNRLAGERLPLEAPNALMIELAKSRESGARDITVTIEPQSYGLIVQCPIRFFSRRLLQCMKPLPVIR